MFLSGMLQPHMISMYRLGAHGRETYPSSCAAGDCDAASAPSLAASAPALSPTSTAVGEDSETASDVYRWVPHALLGSLQMLPIGANAAPGWFATATDCIPAISAWAVTFVVLLQTSY